jgi:Helix-turn-helix.
MASGVGVHRVTLYRYEVHESMPDFDVLDKWARALGYQIFLGIR